MILAGVAGAFLTLGAGRSAAAPDEPDAPSPEDQSGFVYTLPTEAAELPGLAAQLAAEREQARFEFERSSAETIAALPPDSAMARHLTYQQRWTIAGRSGRLLSIASEIYRYDGGAHGNTAYDSRLWDVGDDHGVEFTDLFTDRYAALSVIDRAYCPALRQMQDERGLGDDASAWWNGCPPLHEQTIVPTGEPGGPMTTVLVLVPPYVAGPYAVGSFEIEVPVTGALTALVRSEYRSSFSAQQ